MTHCVYNTTNRIEHNIHISQNHMFDQHSRIICILWFPSWRLLGIIRISYWNTIWCSWNYCISFTHINSNRLIYLCIPETILRQEEAKKKKHITTRLREPLQIERFQLIYLLHSLTRLRCSTKSSKHSISLPNMIKKENNNIIIIGDRCNSFSIS